MSRKAYERVVGTLLVLQAVYLCKSRVKPPMLLSG